MFAEILRADFKRKYKAKLYRRKTTLLYLQQVRTNPADLSVTVKFFE